MKKVLALSLLFLSTTLPFSFKSSFVHQCTVKVDPQKLASTINKEALLDELAEAFIYSVSSTQTQSTHVQLMNTFSVYLPELYLFCELHDVKEVRLSANDHFTYTLVFNLAAQADFIKEELEAVEYISEVDFPSLVKFNALTYLIVTGAFIAVSYPLVKGYMLPALSKVFH